MRLIAVLVASLLLAACAAEPKVMRWTANGEDQASEGRVWPAPQTQEVPRYRYLGQLTGESNFYRPEAEGVPWGKIWDVMKTVEFLKQQVQLFTGFSDERLRELVEGSRAVSFDGQGSHHAPGRRSHPLWRPAERYGPGLCARRR